VEQAGIHFRGAAFRIAMLSCCDLLAVTFFCPSTHTGPSQEASEAAKAERVAGGSLVVLAAGFWLATASCTINFWLDVWQHSAAVGAGPVNLATILLPSTPDLPARRTKLAGSPAGFAVCALKRWVWLDDLLTSERDQTPGLTGNGTIDTSAFDLERLAIPRPGLNA